MRTNLMLPAWVLLVMVSTSMAWGDDQEQPIAADKPAAKLLTWHNSLAPAIEEARRRKTSILVRVGAAWCGWCRRLDKEVILPDVQKELAEWTLVFLDADNDPEEVQRLKVGPIPALRILNSAGRTMRSHDGYLPGAELIRWLKGEDAEPPSELVEDVKEIPELSPSTLVELGRLLAHRDANVREAVVRRLATNKGLAAPEVAKVFIQGKLGPRLASLDLLIDWQAPVKDLDPWRPQTITADRLNELEDWAAKLAEEENPEKSVEPLTEDQLTEVKADIARIAAADVTEMEAIGARLSRFGARLLPFVREQRLSAMSDQARERFDWLRYRLVASDALVLKWPGGLARLAATDAKSCHAAASELPDVVTNGDESLLIELFEHPDSFVRELSLKALHGVGGQRANNELTRLLADPEPNVRAAVLKQMAEKPSNRVVPQIDDYIARETDPDLIVHAVRLLREIKTTESIECLVKLFTHSSWQVRAEAADAVGESVAERYSFGNESKIGASAKADAYTALLELLNDTDGFVVSRAVNAFKGSDFAIAAVPLSKAAEKHPDLAKNISEAMIQGTKILAKSEPILQGWLTHPDEHLRAAALTALHQSGQWDAKTQLIPAFSDPSESVRCAAAGVVWAICESQRPSFPRMKRSLANSGAIDDPDESGSVLGLAKQALGSLFRSGKPPAANGTRKAEEPNRDQENAPYESWLVSVRNGEGRQKWMAEVIPALKQMSASMSTKERLAAGTALVALGVPDALDQLLELARGEPSVAISVASILRWLPWNARVAAFGQLRSLVHEPEQVAQLCDQLVVLRDVRAGESLWQALSDQSIDAASAHSLHMNLLRIHGIESYHGYIDPDTPHDPIGFQVDTVRKIALESEHEWQQRVALALLLQFDSTVALDVAQLLMDRETAKSSIRVDAFVTLLIGNSSNDARQLAVAKLVERDQLFAPTALRYLTGDAELLRSFADGHFHLPNLIAEQQDSELQSELPEELKVEHVEPFLRSSDGNVAARAAYLMAMLGDATHVDILINHWRHSDSRDDWNKLIYEAIATADDPRFVPILVEIYEDLSKNSPHLIRDYYWFIRSMKGPEVLKLRKRIRDEVGMDQLR